MGGKEEEGEGRRPDWQQVIACRGNATCNFYTPAHHPMSKLCTTSLIGTLDILSLHLFHIAPCFGFVVLPYMVLSAEKSNRSLVTSTYDPLCQHEP